MNPRVILPSSRQAIVTDLLILIAGGAAGVAVVLPVLRFDGALFTLTGGLQAVGLLGILAGLLTCALYCVGGAARVISQLLWTAVVTGGASVGMVLRPPLLPVLVGVLVGTVVGGGLVILDRVRVLLVVTWLILVAISIEGGILFAQLVGRGSIDLIPLALIGLTVLVAVHRTYVAQVRQLNEQ